MTVSKYLIIQHTSAHFVESAGAMLFRLATSQVALSTTSRRMNGYCHRAAVTAGNQDVKLHCAKPEKRQGLVAMSTPSLS